MQLSECVISIAKEAARRISLRDHVATHPRLGVVDHIACHHLGEPQQAAAAQSAACRIAAGVSRNLPTLPVILYGDASPQKLRLQDIRRACGMHPPLFPQCRMRQAASGQDEAAVCRVFQGLGAGAVERPAGHHRRLQATAWARRGAPGPRRVRRRQLPADRELQHPRARLVHARRCSLTPLLYVWHGTREGV